MRHKFQCRDNSRPLLEAKITMAVFPINIERGFYERTFYNSLHPFEGGVELFYEQPNEFYDKYLYQVESPV